MTPPLVTVLPPAPPGAWTRPPARSLPFPLDDPRCVVFARARHGLWHAVARLGIRPGDEVLAPAYHHGSEIEALWRAGVVVRFYGGGPDLRPDEDELEALLSPSTRALYLIHFLGWPQDAGRWRRWCDDRGLFLVEDAAQAWLATDGDEPVGAVGDAAVFCLYKTYGLPDGGAVVAPGLEAARGRRAGLGLSSLARQHLRWAVHASSTVASMAGSSPVAHAGAYDAASDFALGDPWSPPVAATRWLLPRLVDPGTAARRRSNAALLLESVGDRVPAPFDDVPSGASPFALPIETDRKELVLELLARRGIRALDFWSVPHPSLPVDRFPDIARRRERTIALPVHQALRSADLERIANAGRRTRPPAVRVEEACTLDDGDLAAEWTRLAGRTGSVFSTWEWAATWYRHFGAGRPLHIVTCRSAAGDLLAVLPLYVTTRAGMPVLRFLGHGPADEMGPVCAAVGRRAAARAVRDLLKDLQPAVLLAEHLPCRDRWSARLGARVLRREGAPTLALAGRTWEGVLAGWSPNLRQQVRRLTRKLENDHAARFRIGTSPERLGADLGTLFALHAARWDDGRSQFDRGHRAFHEDFAATALARGWLRLAFVDVDGRTIAAWHGYRFGGVECYYQAGRDPTSPAPSVGFVLLARSIRAAVEDGMREYRFLRGNEAFKYRFADRDDGIETVGVAVGASARATLAVLGEVPKPVLPPLRRWLAG